MLADSVALLSDIAVGGLRYDDASYKALPVGTRPRDRVMRSCIPAGITGVDYVRVQKTKINTNKKCTVGITGPMRYTIWSGRRNHFSFTDGIHNLVDRIRCPLVFAC